MCVPVRHAYLGKQCGLRATVGGRLTRLHICCEVHKRLQSSTWLRLASMRISRILSDRFESIYHKANARMLVVRRRRPKPWQKPIFEREKFSGKPLPVCHHAYHHTKCLSLRSTWPCRLSLLAGQPTRTSRPSASFPLPLAVTSSLLALTSWPTLAEYAGRLVLL